MHSTLNETIRLKATRPRGSRLVADSRAKKSPARRLSAPGLRMCWMGEGGGASIQQFAG
jgi:hypothetical protein